MSSEEFPLFFDDLFFNKIIPIKKTRKITIKIMYIVLLIYK